MNDTRRPSNAALVRQLDDSWTGDLPEIRVALFSGGSGTTTLARALVAHPQLRLTVLVNAYDDGLSTGRLRRFVPGMLGPSDLRKNAITLMPDDERCQRALRKLLELRFPEGTDRSEAMESLEAIVERRTPTTGPLRELFPDLDLRQIAGLSSALESFFVHERAQLAAGITFDYGDCSIGNLIFTGQHLEAGEQFNRTVERFTELCETRARVLNITDGTSLVLTAIKTDGRLLPDEASIVAPQDDVPIDELFLLDSALETSAIEELDALDTEARRAWLREHQRVPEPNPAALDALREADLVIYGPGTQHSSLFPSYLTRGVRETIVANRDAVKIFVANIREDHDIQKRDLGQILDAFLVYMGRKEQVAVHADELITRSFAQAPDPAVRDRSSADEAAYLALGAPARPGTITERDWEIEGGRHWAGMAVEEILEVVRQTQAVQVRSAREIISIIVPALDEIRTVGRVLDELLTLRLEHPEVEMEVLLVDGGSTDGTVEAARERPQVRVYCLEGTSGRGAALRLGIEKARGSVIVFFPADSEYRVADALRVATPVLQNEYLAVHGSRATKCVDLSGRIRTIYGTDRFGYLVGKYGGIVISTLSLLLYNRFVTDPLTTLKAFDASLLRSLELRSTGVDLEGELVAKLCERQEYILEIPVSYTPRTKQEGKKTRMSDGFGVVWRLLQQRLLLAMKRHAPRLHSRLAQ